MTTESTIPRKLREVWGGTSFDYTATLVDQADNSIIPLASLASLTLTLKVFGEDNPEDDEIVNDREAQDVLNANDVTLHATSGLLTWAAQPEDTEIQDDTLPRHEFETHIAQFVWELTNERTGMHELEVRCKKRA